MERYFAFPGTGTGLHTRAKDVNLDWVNLFGDPNKLACMRPDKNGDWVLFDDALKRSRQEFDNGKAEGKTKIVYKEVSKHCAKCYEDGVAYGTQKAEAEHRDHVITAYEDGLKVGKAQGQAKLDAYIAVNDNSVNQQEYNRGWAEGQASILRAFDKQATLQATLQATPVPTVSWTPPSEKLRGSAADVQVSDTRTNQLLNELYDDRARLERVAQEAASLLKMGHELILARQNGKSAPQIEAEVGDEDYILGQMIAFCDNHGDET